MRFSITRLVSAIALILAALLLVLAGLGLWLWSFYLFATRFLPQDGAALASGAVTFLGAGVLLWIARRMNR